MALLFGNAAAHGKNHIFQHILNGSGQVHLTLGQQLLRRACRTVEQSIELGIGHAQPGAIIEIVHVQLEAAVRLNIDQVVFDHGGEPRLAIGRKPHHLVLAGIHLEAGIVGERRIEQAKRMGKVDLLQHVQLMAMANGQGGGGPFAHPVHGQDGGLMEGGGEEGTRRMTLVVLGEQQLLRPVEVRQMLFEFRVEQRLLKQLLFQPNGHGHGERAVAARRKAQIGLKQALKLQEGLVVECDVIDCVKRDACLTQTVINRPVRKAGIMLFAREAFFLSGGHDFAVADQRCRAVVVEGGDAKKIHMRPRGPLRRWCR